MTQKKVISRRFLGKTEGFVDKSERRFEQAHLKGYLRGQQLFQYGFQWSRDGAQRIPAYHKVKQELIYKED